MAEFKYQAKTREGYVVEGIVDAANQSYAVDILHGKGYVILSLEPLQAGLLEYDIGKYISKPNSKDIAIFTRQLSTLIDADMPLSEGLRTLARQADKASFKKIISEIAEAVEGGSLLSAALAQYPGFFPSFISNWSSREKYPENFMILFSIWRITWKELKASTPK